MRGLLGLNAASLRSPEGCDLLLILVELLLQAADPLRIRVLPRHLSSAPGEVEGCQKLLRQPAASRMLGRSTIQEILLSIRVCSVDRSRAIAIPIHVVQWPVPSRALIANHVILLVRIGITEQLVVGILLPVLLYPVVPGAEPMEEFPIMVLRTEAIVIAKMLSVAVGVDFSVVVVVNWEVIPVILVVAPRVVDVLPSVGSSLDPVEEPLPVKAVVVGRKRSESLGVINAIADVLLFASARIDPVAITIMAFYPILSAVIAIPKIVVYMVMSISITRNEP
mmetsp:Transcript_12847/g.29577  ORF Transcript_12847/g.29577 Transcript_12847/m.29577 type:complete len:280 (-) Transcript_12847:268-1107(-)